MVTRPPRPAGPGRSCGPWHRAPDSGARASGARASGARASGARASGARASGARASGARASGARASRSQLRTNGWPPAGTAGVSRWLSHSSDCGSSRVQLPKL
ncbi:MAG: pentapeptide repeat-containing protein [Streptosporangiaceae bacterium]